MRSIAFAKHGVIVFLALLFLSSSSSANERLFLRAGLVAINAESVKGSLAFEDVSLPETHLGVGDIKQAGLMLSWRLKKNIALETLISTPLKLKFNAGGGLLGPDFHAGSIDGLPLTIIARYDLPWRWKNITTFVGAGGTYLYFRNAHTTPALDELGALFGASDPQLTIKNHWRAIVELGMDYQFSDQWFANLTWLYFEGSTNIDITFSNNTQLTSHVSYAPQIFAFTLGYRF